VEERTASTASIGQIKDLIVTVGQGVPTNLPEETVRGHLGCKDNVHKWIRMGLIHDLSRVDFPLVESVLEGRLALRFSVTVRQSLEADGWQIVEIPGGETLKTLLGDDWKYGHLYGGELEMIPTRYQEVAWYPAEPIWPSTMGKIFSEAVNAKEELEKEAREKYGKEVQVTLPTLELVAYLFSYYLLWPRKSHIIWTLNDFGLFRKATIYIENGAYFSSGKILIEPKDVFNTYGRLGLMRLLEPSF